MVRILVVDDEPDIRWLTRRILEKVGYEVLEAGSGEEGLRILSSTSVDLVLLDVAMPGMNGWTVCRKIKEDANLRHIPVVLFTVLGRFRDELRGRECGADAYIRKPFNKEELLQTVEKVLSRWKEVSFDLSAKA